MKSRRFDVKILLLGFKSGLEIIVSFLINCGVSAACIERMSQISLWAILETYLACSSNLTLFREQVFIWQRFDLVWLTAENHVPTTPQVWGPFFAVGAPFRSKLSPVGAGSFHSLMGHFWYFFLEGDVLVLDGTVYDSESGSIFYHLSVTLNIRDETGEAIPFAVLDVWQASGKVSEKGGEYDYFEEGDERREYKEEINTIGPQFDRPWSPYFLTFRKS